MRSPLSVRKLSQQKQTVYLGIFEMAEQLITDKHIRATAEQRYAFCNATVTILAI